MTHDNLPACPTGEEEKCAFYHSPSCQTLLFSPVAYNRAGEPIGGGGNAVSQIVRCESCGKSWRSVQSELEDAKGIKRVWYPANS